MSSAESSEEFVLLAIPDMNGSLRGKALRPAAFDAAVQHGTVMTDLIIGLDPTDTPITDYERFGIRTGAADLFVTPEVGIELARGDKVKIGITGDCLTGPAVPEEKTAW